MSQAKARHTTPAGPVAVAQPTGDERLIELAAQFRAAWLSIYREADYGRRAVKGSAAKKAASDHYDRSVNEMWKAADRIANTQPSGLHGVMISLESVFALDRREPRWGGNPDLRAACLAFRTLSKITGITSNKCLDMFSACKRDDMACCCVDKD